MVGTVSMAASSWFAADDDLRPANHMGYTTSRFVLSICRRQNHSSRHLVKAASNVTHHAVVVCLQCVAGGRRLLPEPPAG
jgi:hypothetical protein